MLGNGGESDPQSLADTRTVIRRVWTKSGSRGAFYLSIYFEAFLPRLSPAKAKMVSMGRLVSTVIFQCFFNLFYK